MPKPPWARTTTCKATKATTTNGASGVVMNYNLFRGGSDKARLAANAHEINQAMDIRNNALRQLNENIHLAWNAMVNAKKQTPTAREYAETTKRVRAGVSGSVRPRPTDPARPARQ